MADGPVGPKWWTAVEEVEREGGPPVDPPLHKIAVAAVIWNPCQPWFRRSGRWLYRPIRVASAAVAAESTGAR